MHTVQLLSCTTITIPPLGCMKLPNSLYHKPWKFECTRWSSAAICDSGATMTNPSAMCLCSTWKCSSDIIFWASLHYRPITKLSFKSPVNLFSDINSGLIFLYSGSEGLSSHHTIFSSSLETNQRQRPTCSIIRKVRLHRLLLPPFLLPPSRIQEPKETLTRKLATAFLAQSYLYQSMQSISSMHPTASHSTLSNLQIPRSPESVFMTKRVCSCSAHQSPMSIHLAV